MCREFDYLKLLGRIKEKGLTQETVARAISRNPCTFSQKLNNKAAFTAPEISGVCDVLEIGSEEVGIYFFTPKVQKVGLYERRR